MGTKSFTTLLNAQLLKSAFNRFSIVGQPLFLPPGQVAQTGWALNGRLSNAQLQPVAGFTVFLVDAGNRFQPQYGFATTNFTGYFLINYAGSSGQASYPPRLFIRVADPEGNLVYQSSSPLFPMLGTLSFQNITLPR
jgi:hypothetical protein